MTSNSNKKEKEIKINICDGSAMKRVLDDSAISFFITKKEFEEDFNISNWKIFLSFISALLGLLAHYYPEPYPKNYYILIFCILSYFFLSGILQLISMFVEKDFILFTKPKILQFNSTPISIKVRSTLPKYDYHYTISIINRSIPEQQETFTKSVECWFEESGLFVEQQFHKDLEQLYNSFFKKKK